MDTLSHVNIYVMFSTILRWFYWALYLNIRIVRLSIQHSHYWTIFTTRERSLVQGNIFTGVCLSTRGLCIMSPDVWLPGPIFLLGESLSLAPCSFWGFSVHWGLVSVQGGLCPRGLSVQGGSVSKGLCQGGLCPSGVSVLRGSMSKGPLSKGASVQGGLCPGGLCPRGSLSRGPLSKRCL